MCDYKVWSSSDITNKPNYQKVETACRCSRVYKTRCIKRTYLFHGLLFPSLSAIVVYSILPRPRFKKSVEQRLVAFLDVQFYARRSR